MIENNNTSIISDDDDRELNKYEKIDFLNKMLELGDNINNEDYEEENIKLITKKKKEKNKAISKNN